MIETDMKKNEALFFDLLGSEMVTLPKQGMIIFAILYLTCPLLFMAKI